MSILKFKNWSILTGDLLFLNSKRNSSKRPCFPDIGLFSLVTYPFWNSKTSLFSQATYPFQILKRTSPSIHTFLKLVYLHGRSAHFEIQKLIYFYERPVLLQFKLGSGYLFIS
jgi:hypothetical protein